MIGFVVVAILALILVSGLIGYSNGYSEGFNCAARQWANKYNVDMHNKHQEWTNYISRL